jgi:tRNA modification GTPase
MVVMQDECTIIAQCTPQGPGALALLRLSGSNAIEVASTIALLPSSKNLSSVASHTIHFGWVINNAQEKIDQVLFLVMHGPHTFTGHHTVEITCHNNQFIIQEIIQAAICAGARLAHEGEFSKRAVLNNKIDLVQAEAINELIHANTQAGLKKSLAQLQGSLSHWVTAIEQEMIKALAFCQASFEFIDEEISFGSQIQEIIDTILSTIARIKTTFNQQQQIRQGIRIALIGSVNAGKSSLFNALVGKERAIVTNIAGTTRDAIEAGLYKNGNYWTLIDTAGLRVTNDIIEQQGIQRSFAEAQQADIILLIVDPSRHLTSHEQEVYTTLFEQYNSKIIIIYSKSDLPVVTPLQYASHGLTVSLSDKQSIINIETALEEKITTLFSSLESPFLLNTRHYTLLLHVEQALHIVCNMLQDPIHYELVAFHLNEALSNLSQLTGKSISEQSMDAVFRQFCVGK